jgi:hypothetical protein
MLLQSIKNKNINIVLKKLKILLQINIVMFNNYLILISIIIIKIILKLNKNAKINIFNIFKNHHISEKSSFKSPTISVFK